MYPNHFLHQSGYILGTHDFVFYYYFTNIGGVFLIYLHAAQKYIVVSTQPRAMPRAKPRTQLHNIFFQLFFKNVFFEIFSKTWSLRVRL